MLSGEPSASKNETVTLSHEGQQILVVDPQSQLQPSRHKKQIVDFPTWTQAFLIYAVGLAAANFTAEEQIMGLMAHMFIMIQLSWDLVGNHWLQYDKDFREWAAAKHLKVWGELNLTIYGRCLAMHQCPMLAPRSTVSLRNEPNLKGHRGAAVTSGILTALVKSLLPLAGIGICATTVEMITEQQIVYLQCEKFRAAVVWAL